MAHESSVDNPKPSAAESAQVVESVTEKIAPAGDGKEPPTFSRAAKSLLVVGKFQGEVASSIGLETVIGSDERVRVFETDLDPWRRICALRMTAPNGSAFLGTGWLAGPRTVMTAGHCVADQMEMGGWAVSISVTPGQNGDVKPFPTYTSASFSAHERWVSSRDPDYDIGCIHLKEPIGNTTGWFGIAALPAAELQGYLLNIAGYPADLSSGKELYFSKNRIVRVSPRRIFNEVDTYGGQSGSPAWVYKAAGDQPLVVGVHAYGTGGTPADLNILANSAPLIDSTILDLMQSWIAADAAT